MGINSLKTLSLFFSSPTDLQVFHYPIRVTGGGMVGRKAIAPEFAKEGAKVAITGELTKLREFVESGSHCGRLERDFRKSLEISDYND